ncbi:MAG: DUF3836 domain-containing protein [Dysgonomonas sp.]|nr:DUF3836 domain-containing protein [Dysgonomonas sp.]
MKANVFTSALIALFLFAINPLVVKADSDAVLYHNVEKQDNIVSTTYFKGNGNSENLIPYKKKVNIMNEEGACIEKVTYIWNSNQKNWTPIDKRQYVYDNGKVINISRYAWNDKRNNWNNPTTISYNYDEENLLAK